MTTRTSTTHPLQIAAVQAGPGLGSVGVTICPGKKDPHAMTGAWDRGVDLDVKAIANWGAAVVVTLMEDHELTTLQVPHLGDRVRHHQIEWFHLPIPDVSTPDNAFETSWRTAGQHLRDLLRCGFNVLFHCKGGLGRSGMMAARTLAELGWAPMEAVQAIRAARPGAIETMAQERVILHAKPVPTPEPKTDDASRRDRAVGALLGLAVGDAVGTTLEFRKRDSDAPLTDMIGGGPFHLEAGQWTDDTQMALALADSLLAHPDLDEIDLMKRFVAWWRKGEYSCTGTCFDIGITTRTALQRFKDTGNPIAGSIDPRSAGNGSLMRLSPVAIRHWNDTTALVDVARRQSATTHGAQEAVDACAAFAELLAAAISGANKTELLTPRATAYVDAVKAILNGSWRGKARNHIASSGYVIHSLEAALWCVGRSTNFREAILLATNLGDDADTVGAITGQLAGALWGASAIPPTWLERLAWRERITDMAASLFDASLT